MINPIGTIVLQSLPIVSDRYFERLRGSLVDRNIYDVGEGAIPYPSGSVRVGGTLTGVASPVTLSLYVNDSLLGTFSSKTGGTWDVGIRLVKGRNKIDVKKADGTLVGGSLYLNAYAIHTFLSAYAEQLSGLRDLLEAGRQNLMLEDGTDLDGNAIQTTPAALRDNIGQYTSARKLAPATRLEYQTLLRNILRAYFYAPSVRSLDILAAEYLGVVGTFIYYRDTSYAYPDGGGVKFTLRGFAGFILDYTGGEFWMYCRWFTFLAGSVTLAASKRYWLYVDGTLDLNGNLALQVLEITTPGVTFPLRLPTGRAQVIPQASIRTDTDGVKTGIPGTLYVETDRIPIALSTVTGSVSGALPASIVEGTGWVSLGVQFPYSGVGNVSISYTFYTEPRILARVTTGASDVLAVEFNARMRKKTSPDGTTGGLWPIAFLSEANEFIAIFPNYQLLPVDDRENFDTIQREVKASHKLKIHGENVVYPSPKFPGPLSAELGATTRKQLPALVVLGAELGATRRAWFPPSPVTPDSLLGELGSSSRDNGAS